MTAATQETTQESRIPDRILDLIRKKPDITRNELAEKISGITSDGIKYHLEKLKSEGVIKHTGPTKAGKWIIINDR